MKSYKDLDIYNLSLNLFYGTHKISFKLPNYKLYELGSQVRRSSDSVVTNMVEKQNRISFLSVSENLLRRLVYTCTVQYRVPV